MPPVKNFCEMVQKIECGPCAPRRRGRPRAYGPDVALAQARDAFWKDGFAATCRRSSGATGMNRPSLYAAFGDKRELYVKAYGTIATRLARHSRRFSSAAARPAAAHLGSPARSLFLGRGGPRGCFTVLTAASDASSIRTSVRSSSRRWPASTGRSPGLFAAGVETGELPEDAEACAPRPHGLGDDPLPVGPSPRPLPSRGARADRRRRGCDDLRARGFPWRQAKRKASKWIVSPY